MRYREGNILDVDADAIIVTVDGSSVDSMGSIASQLRRRMGDAWDDIEDQLEFPIPLGNIQIATITETINEDAQEPVNFKHVFFLSVLDHLQEVQASQRPEIVRKGLVRALEVAAQLGLKTVASPLLRCGWRVTEDMAHKIMRSADELCAGNGVILILNQLPRR